MKPKPTTNRRQFLSQCLRGAALLSAGACSALPAAADTTTGSEKSRVVVARDPLLRGPGTDVDAKRIAALVDRALLAFFGLPESSQNPAEAWRKIVKPADTVSLKVNTLGGRGISTSTVLVEEICERLQQAGVRASNILVWDRDTAELERAGFRASVGGERVQCYGTDHAGYEDDLSAWGSVGSRLSKILTRQTSVLINLPVLKDHDGAGVTLALKNMYGAVHNPNKYHPNGCNPYVADLNMLPEIRSRMRLSICDATTAMYEGGPGFKPEHSWKPNALLVATDPVALDWTGWQMIERKRREMGLKTLDADGRAPAYISTAADSDHRLGHADPARIETLEI